VKSPGSVAIVPNGPAVCFVCVPRTLGGVGAIFALSACNKAFLSLQMRQSKHRDIGAMQKL
jgi:hypothetical protein